MARGVMRAAADGIGGRIRTYRLYRGMSIETLAGLSGLSKGFISMVESGDRDLQRRHDVTAVARALRVSVVDLTGQPHVGEGDPATDDVQASVQAIRLSLLETVLGDPAEATPRPVAALERETQRVVALRAACEFTEVGRMLPRLILELHAALPTAGRDRRRVLIALFRACHSASSLARNFGHPDLAWIAADRVREVADDLGPLWQAAAEFPRAHALMPAGAHVRALSVASRGADAARALSGNTETAPALAIHGALLLASSFAAGAAGHDQEASDRLSEAQRVAERTGEQGMDAFQFGPTNVGIHRISVAVELGEGGRVEEIARGIDPSQIDNRERQAMYHADVGRGLAQVKGREDDATAHLWTALEIAPLRVRSNPFVLQLVARMDRAPGASRQTHALAEALGVSTRSQS